MINQSSHGGITVQTGVQSSLRLTSSKDNYFLLLHFSPSLIVRMRINGLNYRLKRRYLNKGFQNYKKYI
jgi:hypothetical protein